MRRKRVMVIGPTNCGKTTLVNVLNDNKEPARKTQDIIYGKNTMDVPGAYIENAWMYQHLIAASQDASHVLILVDQSKRSDLYSPGFAKVFRCPVIGVISKSDLMPENEEFCIQQLRRIGVKEPYYRISCLNGTGIGTLINDLLIDNEK
ncbi:MAG TPA: EutP/PduV family microcompartment system protein [Mobilitalea sp.]|nr:EutP/PduV family microcompartment system protein [Mobilitalea sp.]